MANKYSPITNLSLDDNNQMKLLSETLRKQAIAKRNAQDQKMQETNFDYTQQQRKDLETSEAARYGALKEQLKPGGQYASSSLYDMVSKYEGNGVQSAEAEQQVAQRIAQLQAIDKGKADVDVKKAKQEQTITSYSNLRKLYPQYETTILANEVGGGTPREALNDIQGQMTTAGKSSCGKAEPKDSEEEGFIKAIVPKTRSGFMYKRGINDQSGEPTTGQFKVEYRKGTWYYAGTKQKVDLTDPNWIAESDVSGVPVRGILGTVKNTNPKPQPKPIKSTPIVKENGFTFTREQ
jgi:hypothetical protein